MGRLDRTIRLRLRLTKTGSESGVGLGHVDALVEDVGGGGGGLGEHDRLREGGGVGGAQVGGLRMVGGPGVRRRRRVVTSLGWGQLGHRVVHRSLLLLDVGGGGGPPASPHTRVGGVGLVLGPRPLQIILQVSVNVSVI